MKFDNTQKELLNYVSNHSIFKIFLPIAEVLLLGGEGINLLEHFGLELGFLETVIYFICYIGIVMTLAKANYKILTIGLGMRTFGCVYKILRNLLRLRLTNCLTYAINAAVWGYFAYLAYKKWNGQKQ